jgi:hypothetical protein
LRDITIKSERSRVEELFAPYRALLGHDFDGYRNHVYRCITYAMRFLDNATEYEQIVETAFVYHDIGLWTDQELAYLEPSEAVALKDNDKYGWGLDPDALRGAIHWHHKVFKYNGTSRGRHRGMPQSRLDRRNARLVPQGNAQIGHRESRIHISQLRISQSPSAAGQGIWRFNACWWLQSDARNREMVTRVGALTTRLLLSNSHCPWPRR